MVFNKIYVLENVSNTKELFCTYNINLGNVSTSIIPNTISMHRKKQTNTLYTINALNEIVKKENNGHIDPSYMIDWNNYKNSIVLTDMNGMKRINTSLNRIINI